MHASALEAEHAEPWSVRVDAHDPRAAEHIASSLASQILSHASWERIVVVCIGTDRSTGDALGPLVGSLLTEQLACGLDGPPLEGVDIRGTLEDPVHAMNLRDACGDLAAAQRTHLVVGVDACLGQAEQVGTISLGLGPVRPGAGVNKALPPVGSLHITGTVNTGGFMEYLVLQNTRLSLVMRMAKVIAQGIAAAMAAVKSARGEALACLPAHRDLS
ncbi:MAG: spore protease YyaC [Bacillota bacterium]|nr:spore protease YyaC [Bacillota bacterium]